MGRFRRILFRGVGVVAVGATAFDLTNDRVITRSLRTLVGAARVAYAYKFTDVETVEQLSNLNQHAAQIMLDTCLANEGLYIKFAQGMSTMNHVLPPEFSKTLAVCLDKAPQVPFEEVKGIIQQETGKPLEDLFVEFNQEAVAAASIAQVHRAKYKDPKSGEVLDVAVKVQKPKIRKQSWWDLTTHTIVCWGLEKVFDFPVMWAAHVIEETSTRELDFTIEAGHIERAKKNFENRHDVVVPEVVPDVLSPRLLVTEWMDAIKLSDTHAVQANFSIPDVMRTLCESLGDMLFTHGFVHADPHPANVLVRPYQPKKGASSSSPSSTAAGTPLPKHQVVLLDWGMAVSESEQFMDDYSRMFTSVFAHDFAELERIMNGWGIRHGELFASMMIQKPLRKDMTNDKPLTKEEVQALQRKMKLQAKDLLQDDQLVPRELVFVGRAMNIVRSVNKSYQAPVNRINILADCAMAAQRRLRATKSEKEEGGAEGHRPASVAGVSGDESLRRRINIQFTKTVLSTLFVVTSAYAWILSLFFGAPALPISADPEFAAANPNGTGGGGVTGKTMEDMLEEQEREAFQHHFHSFNVNPRD